MRAPSDMPARRARTPRLRVGVLIAVAVVVALLLSLRGVAGFYTDYLWFDSLHFAKVWRGILGAKVVLAVLFSVVFFLIAWGNLTIADRLAPRFRPAGPEEELVVRYHELVGTHTRAVRIVTAAVLGLIAGIPTSGQWNDWVLFANRQTFNMKDPLFHKDVGYYVFQLPFLKFLVDWAFASMVIILLLTAVAHYLNGGIRVQVPAIQRVTPQVKAHLSVLLGVLALLKAVGYWLQRYELTFSTRGVVDGASYTDVKAQLPALYLLIAISLFAAGLFIYNIRQRGWVLPVIGVGLWAFTSIVVGGLVPAFVQKFTVQPNQAEKEQPYITRNIRATRFALGIDKVKVNNFAYEPALSSGDLADNAATVRNARLWDPAIIGATYDQQQAIRQFYGFNQPVDVDRYQVDGQLTQVLLSARELDPTGIPSKTWINEHLNYTHGYGAVVNPANAVDPSGLPVYLTQDLPPTTTNFDWKQPAVYFGENLPGYAIVNTKQSETDFQSDKGTVRTQYKGTGGVAMSSLVRRAALALRFGDINPLISSVVTEKSRAIYIRDIRDRVRKVAPFLKFDADPYPVILDGRVTWVQDAYTTTSRFPYSQRAPTSRLDGGSGLNTRFNYIRNSVKVAIDAYNGNLSFYVVDKADPIVKAYQKAFPDLFVTKPAPKALRDHFRYPEDMFRVQTDALALYHIQDAREFYEQGDAWDIARDPGSGRIANPADNPPTTPTTTAPGTTEGAVTAKRMDPYYLLMRLPNESTENFLILQPFTPAKKDLLSSFAVAKSDGSLEVFVMPRDESVPGPVQVDASINQQREISSQISLLNTQGSRLLNGNLVLIPVNRSLLYIRPLYIEARNNPVPELKLVVVAQNNRVVAAPTLKDALTELFGSAPPTLEQGAGQKPPGGATTPPPTTQQPPSGNVASLLDQAQQAFDRADAALRSGDLKGYADAIAQARAFIAQASAQSGATPGVPNQSGAGSTSPGAASPGTSSPGSGSGSGSGSGAPSGAPSPTTTTTAPASA